MKIYKFGGASLKNTKVSFENIYEILKNEKNLIIVISAIDKTTNALEKLVDAYFDNDEFNFKKILNNITDFHINFAKNLYNNDLRNEHLRSSMKFIEDLLSDYWNFISFKFEFYYDELYDNVVKAGEIISSFLVAEYLKYKQLQIEWVDIQKIIITTANHRDAKVIWKKSKKKVKDRFSNNNSIFVTQGFIGKSANGANTTLGREGSDYTAAALGYLLNAESVTVWKDVPGIMNADPVIFPEIAQKIDTLSFNEAIELAFYGAKIIHPKTIKPLENKNIPLYVKSFLNPELEGTTIKYLDFKLNLTPVYILKENQILISITPKDFSFIVEKNMSKIFAIFAKENIKVNIIQNSAISFSATIDKNVRNFSHLISKLQKEYIVKYNENLDLITIRYYNDEAIAKITKGRTILLEQRSRNTARFVLG